MPTPKELTVDIDPLTRSARFHLAFAAPPEDGSVDCAAVSLDTGDGDLIELGERCAPTHVAWRDNRELVLAAHTYDTDGSFRAILHWGEERFTAEVDAAPPPTPLAAPAGVGGPALDLFELRRINDNPFAVMLAVHVSGLTSEQRVRVDSGGGPIVWIDAAGGSAQRSATLEYAKIGEYNVTVDLVDGRGFWLATLGEAPLSVAEPVEPPASAALAPAVAAEVALAVTISPDVSEMASSSAVATPWLPFRYARPAWAWARTYKAAGSSAVSRSLAPGAYLAIRQETAVAGQLWYQTGGYDWIQASSVALLTPSELRGVELQGPGPGPGPTPDPGPVRYGVVTVRVLNVRAQPGVRPDNPVIGTLVYNSSVSIYEESSYAGALWYRIGDNRWVYAAYIRVLPSAQGDRMPAAAPLAAALQPTLPLGWIVAPSLYVRAEPATTAAIVGELPHNQAVNVLETQNVAGQSWLRIGAGQWVTSAWVGVARAKARPLQIGANERWVGVCLKEQTAIAYEGDKPVYAALVATGLPGTPTVQGIFRTWWRVDSRRMAGGSGAGYYYLEEVTWTCYFHGGYALHTAYWHDAFGRTRSHGCVNLSPYDAWWIFQWSAVGGAKSPAVYVYWS